MKFTVNKSIVLVLYVRIFGVHSVVCGQLVGDLQQPKDPKFLSIQMIVSYLVKLDLTSLIARPIGGVGYFKVSGDKEREKEKKQPKVAIKWLKEHTEIP